MNHRFKALIEPAVPLSAGQVVHALEREIQALQREHWHLRHASQGEATSAPQYDGSYTAPITTVIGDAGSAIHLNTRFSLGADEPRSLMIALGSEDVANYVNMPQHSILLRYGDHEEDLALLKCFASAITGKQRFLLVSAEGDDRWYNVSTEGDDKWSWSISKGDLLDSTYSVADLLDACSILSSTDKKGAFQIGSTGCYIQTDDDLASEQKDWDDLDPSKNQDFSCSPYWITTDNGEDPTAIKTKYELVDFFHEHGWSLLELADVATSTDPLLSDATILNSSTLSAG